eukprot:539990-Prorocentrum_minimum.AAC.1
MRALGGVPELLSAEDFEDGGAGEGGVGHDERALLGYVSFLFARLIEFHHENRNALHIQVQPDPIGPPLDPLHY